MFGPSTSIYNTRLQLYSCTQQKKSIKGFSLPTKLGLLLAYKKVKIHQIEFFFLSKKYI
jgi:hypothetical protein